MNDFDFLQGSFEVRGRRLADPFDPSSGWTDVSATSEALLLFDGAVSIDEMWFPEEQRFGMSLRLFDPRSRTWTVRWVDGRGGALQPPVAGHWQGDHCLLTGPDDYRGRPVERSHSWRDAADSSAQWEQCYSVDGGHTWQPNQTMTFTRNRTVQHPREPRVTTDFDFLGGEWQVHHRRALDPVAHALGRSSEVTEFDGTHYGRSFFAGAVSVDEALLGEGRRGLTFRTFDPTTNQWSIWWVNSHLGQLEPPVHGSFHNGIGRFDGSETIEDRHVEIRFTWSGVTPTAAVWRQEFSVDGSDWDENWQMTFHRPESRTPVVAQEI